MAATKRTPFNIAAGARLARVRIALKMKQEAMGEMLGASRQQIANYEQGARTPAPEVMAKLYELHGVPTDFIYTGDKRMLPNWLALEIASQPEKLPPPPRQKESKPRHRVTKVS